MPSDAEWLELTTYLGGTSLAGGKLKEESTNYWYSPNTGATNETGFTALPGGNRDSGGTFNSLRNYGYWWSTTEYLPNTAWPRMMNFNNSSVYKNNYIKSTGFSVRCVRD